jgi:amino acid transporter
MVEEPKLFTRKATGLVRSIGISTAVILALCNVVGLGWQKKVFQAAGWAPIGDDKFFLGMHPMVMAFLLAGVLILISVYCFAVLSAAMPKSGGGYIFISRILSPRLGFIATWLQFWAVAVSYGIIAVAVIEVIILFGGRAGISEGIISFLKLSGIKFAIGVVVMFLFSAIACTGIKQTGRMLHVIFWIPLAVLVVVYILFITATPETMAAGVQAAYKHSALEYTRGALLSGMGAAGAGITYWGAVGAAIIAAYWAFIGYASATFVAGEVKEAHKTLPKALLISGIAIVVLYMSISFLMARAGMMVGKSDNHSLFSSMAYLNYGKDIKPEDDVFLKTEKKLEQEKDFARLDREERRFAIAGIKLAEQDLVKIGAPAAPALEKVITDLRNSGKTKSAERLAALREKVLNASDGTEATEEEMAHLAVMAHKGLPHIGGWMPFLADIQATGVGINWLMVVLVMFAALWVANDIPPFILTSSRMIFAMAFDGVLPKKLAKVNQKWHSPVNAVIFVSLVSVLGAAAEANIFGKDAPIISSSGVLMSTAIWDCIFFTFCALACVFFPIRKPGIFEKSPFRASKSMVMFIGILATVGNGILLVIMATTAYGWNILGWEKFSDAGTFLFSVCLIIAGLLIYQYYSTSSKRTGVELTTVFTEIPPD